MAMDDIEYQIFGTDMQYAEVELDPGEAAIGEAGMMMFMEEGIDMDTVFGDGSQQGGVFGKLLVAGKRLMGAASTTTTSGNGALLGAGALSGLGALGGLMGDDD